MRLLALLSVLAAALALRLYGIDWDQGGFFHPDERFLLLFKLPEIHWPDSFLEFLNPTISPWNPHWFAYGSLPFYLLKGLQALVLSFNPAFSLDDMRFLGRGLSAVADVGAIVLTYLLGRTLYGWRVGLLASAFLALTVLHIQLSHFAAVDVLLTLWVVLTLCGAMVVMRRGSVAGGLLVGVGLGLGLATKISILPLLAPVAAAFALYCFFPEGTALHAPKLEGRRIVRGSRALAAAAVVAAGLFVIVQPYAVLDLSTFLADTTAQSQMVLRVDDLPYTRQYIDTPMYLYPIQQHLTWGLGFPLGIAAWLGLAFTVLLAFRHRQKADLLLLAWIVPYFVITGAFPVKFMRYLLPITPFLLILASRMFVTWWDNRPRLAQPAYARLTRPAGPKETGHLTALRLAVARALPGVTLAIVLIATAWYALAFLNIYQQPHTARQLSAWINANAPTGAALLKEHWEEGIPGLEAYAQNELPLYEPDNTAKLNTLSLELARSDYVIFFSNRLYGTIPRLAERYPLSRQYYELLFSGQLGYRLAYTAASYPSFLGVTWVNDTFGRPNLPTPDGLHYPDQGLVLNLGYADESFTVYDHPLTMIFENVERRPVSQLRAQLARGLPALDPTASNPPTGLLMDEGLRAVQQAGGTWVDIFQRDSVPNRFPWLVWLLAVEVLGLLAFPLAHRLCTAFPDRGWLLAKTLGLLVVSYLVWWTASVQWLPFSRESILLAMGLLLAVGAGLALQDRAQLAETVRQRWRAMTLGEAVFLAAFLCFILIRLANSDLWHPARGGEKPMDFAYLNAIIKSTYMPPYDPWYSGGYLNYYYYGQFLVAVLAKLTGIIPAVAYNLAVPSLFALLAANTYSIGSALFTATGLRPTLHPHFRRLTDTSGPAANHNAGMAGEGRHTPLLWLTLAGGTAVLMVAVVGNLDGAVQVLDGLRKLSPLHPPSLLPGVGGLFEVAGGIWQSVTRGEPLPAFDYWRSRGMGGMDSSFIDPTLNAPSISIVEFPFFTFLFADLHAHLIALPLVAFSIALSGQLALSRPPWRFERILLLLLAGMTLGAVRWTNSWDYPTVLLIAWAGLAIGEATNRQLSWGLLPRLAWQGLAVTAVSIALFLPLQFHYELFYGGGLAPSPETTPLSIYLRIHGLFLFVILGFLGFDLAQRFNRFGLFRTAGLFWRQRYAMGRARHLRQVLVRRDDPLSTIILLGLLGGGVIFLLLSSVGAATAGFLLLLLGLVTTLGLTELRAPTQRRGAGYLLVLALIAVAAFLSLLVEVVKLDIPGEVQRMNNVFKLYLQVWMLYALSAALGLWWVLRQRYFPGLPGSTIATDPSLQRATSPAMRWWFAGVAVLAAAALVYPVLATPIRTADRFTTLPPTLDGSAYMLHSTYSDARGGIELQWDYHAIQWLQDHVQGSPVILEGISPIYRWGSRISIHTGLPTVLGWDWHQSQQRWGYRASIETRMRDVTALYTTPDIEATMQLLDKYGVRYVYVGQLERLYFPPTGIAKFEQLAHAGVITRVYTNDAVTIYKVPG